MRACLLALCLLPLLEHAEAEEVTLATELGPLAATLEVPSEGRMRAMVLLIPGSGPTDRNGNSFALPGPNNGLRYLAEALLAQRIGSLRFDKRLIGASATDRLSEADLLFDTYVEDVGLWVEYLRGRFEAPIYVLGHSEGSLVGIVAAQSVELSGVIGVAGPGRRASEVLLEQLRPQLPAPLLVEAERIVAELARAARSQDPRPRSPRCFARASSRISSRGSRTIPRNRSGGCAFPCCSSTARPTCRSRPRRAISCDARIRERFTPSSRA